MTAYKTKYETRLLYSQSYLADESVHVSTDTHAVLWSFGISEPTTTRVRLTFIYNVDMKGVTPVQGLIEQWKKDGWTVIDEFCDGFLEFDDLEGFRKHMLEMTRCFLLGVPFGSEVQGSDIPPSTPPIRKIGLKTSKSRSTSRLDSIIKKSSEKPGNNSNNEEEDDTYARSSSFSKSNVTSKEDSQKDIIMPFSGSASELGKDIPDDDDDDDWI